MRGLRSSVYSLRSLFWALSLVLCALSLGAPPAHAQINMPDPSLINGKAIPAPELPNGTVTVRVVRESIGNNLPGQTVRLTTGSAGRDAKTDDQGRATFDNLAPGVQSGAEVTVDGERIVSDPFIVPATGGLRVILVSGLKQAAARRSQEEAAAAAAPAVKGTIVLGGSTRMQMRFANDVLQVFYMLDIVNNARNRVDIGGPLIIDLPTGAAGATLLDGSAPATINGARVTVQGPFNSGTTSVQFAFVLQYDDANETVVQKWPVALERVGLAAQRVGGLGISSPQFEAVEEVRANDGTPYLLGTGPGLAAGSTMTLQLTNLPIHSKTPRYIGLALAAGFIAFGIWLSVSGGTRDEEVRRRLVHRRDTLLGELAQLEQRRRAGTLDARATARHEKLVAELEQIYGELDDATIGPRGGGEGLAA